ncbi:hypothetical protein OIU84_011061 [Salix udensis]|uniref:Pentatricopeptide repeat-containing protein n=1 Tax=Salix udensis TaxID=889485 RepID=A0AAD6JM38_9ROSI|nr:hypothetical protein OIU84_011061 [Salix udensis]
MSSLILNKSADIKTRLFQGFDSLKHLKHVHAALLRLGLDEDTYLLNKESIETYHSMRKEGLSPDSFTFPFLLKACARLFDSKLGMKLHGLVVKAGCESDAFVNTSLVSLYGKCGFVDYAFKVFDDIPEKNVASWTAIISGYIGIGKCREAIDMFRRLLGMGLRPDSFSLVRVLAACTRIGDLRSGEWIDDYITEIGMRL